MRFGGATCASLLWVWSCLAHAGTEPLSIYDSGDTVSLEPSYAAAGIDDASLLERIAPPLSFSRDFVERMRTTVRTQKLSPGVQPRIPTGPAGRMLPRPLFLIGPDTASLSWLESVKERLTTLGAVGLIVRADGPADVERIRAVAGQLPLALGSGDVLADRFGIRHYPVLIGPVWIEQ